MQELDETDRRLLSALQKNGRVTNAELSEAVHLSASACHRRVQRLEAEGYIKNYVAMLDARISYCGGSVVRAVSSGADENLVQLVVLHQLAHPDEVLIRRARAFRTAPPFRDERLTIVKRKHGVGVSDVDR